MAQPAAVIALRRLWRAGLGRAAEMGAHADKRPAIRGARPVLFRLARWRAPADVHSESIGCRPSLARCRGNWRFLPAGRSDPDRNRARRGNLGRCPASDKKRMAAPGECHRLSRLNGREVDFDRRHCEHIRRRIHLYNQRDKCRGSADNTHRAGGDIKKITSRRLGRFRKSHSYDPLKLALQASSLEPEALSWYPDMI